MYRTKKSEDRSALDTKQAVTKSDRLEMSFWGHAAKAVMSDKKDADMDELQAWTGATRVGVLRGGKRGHSMQIIFSYGV